MCLWGSTVNHSLIHSRAQSSFHPSKYSISQRTRVAFSSRNPSEIPKIAPSTACCQLFHSYVGYVNKEMCVFVPFSLWSTKQTGLHPALIGYESHCFLESGYIHVSFVHVNRSLCAFLMDGSSSDHLLASLAVVESVFSRLTACSAKQNYQVRKTTLFSKLIMTVLYGFIYSVNRHLNICAFLYMSSPRINRVTLLL